MRNFVWKFLRFWGIIEVFVWVQLVHYSGVDVCMCSRPTELSLVHSTRQEEHLLAQGLQILGSPQAQEAVAN